MRYSVYGKMWPGQILPGQISSWLLESGLDVPRNLQCRPKKTHSTKMIFLGPKKCFIHNFLKIVIFEVMYLELGDLLWSSLLRNFFSAARSIFSCKYFICFIQYILRFRNQFKIWVSGWVVGSIGQIENKAISAFN